MAATSAVVLAQDPAPSLVPTLDDVQVPADPHATHRIELSLEDALALARQGNTAIAIASLSPRIASQDVRIAQAFFEPEMFADAGGRRTRTVQQGAFQPTTTREIIDARLGWRQRVITGGLFELAFAPVKFVQNQNAFFGNNDVRLWTSDVTLTYSQPLLRGGWIDYVTAPVRSAEFAVTQSQGTFERAMQNALLDVVRAFWELVFARENYRATFAAMELAQEQLRITEERIRVRELAERDRVTDEAEVAQRREELIAAENEIQARADDLRRLLMRDEDGQMWSTEIVPKDTFEAELPEGAPDWRGPAEDALRNRPDLRAAQAAVGDAELGEREARNELMPDLSFVGEYGSTGSGSNFPDSLSRVWDLDAPDWSVRLQLSVPVGNSAARAAMRRARLVAEEARRRLYSARLDVVKEVRDAVRELATSAERVRASRESVRLAEVELDTAQRKYRVGELTPFDVRLRNQSLFEARTRLLRNQLDFRINEARLKHAQGQLRAPGGEPEPSDGEPDGGR